MSDPVCECCGDEPAEAVAVKGRKRVLCADCARELLTGQIPDVVKSRLGAKARGTRRRDDDFGFDRAARAMEDGR